MWQNLKEIGCSDKNKSKAKIVHRIADKLCHAILQMCNYVNEFFTTVASNLVKKMQAHVPLYGVDSKKFNGFYANKCITPVNSNSKQ